MSFYFGTAIRRIKERIGFVFIEADYEPIEFRSSILLLISSFAVGNPYTHLFANSITYAFISSIFSESVLASIFIFVATNSLLAYFQGNLVYRAIMSTVQGAIWLLLFVLLVQSNTEVWFPYFLPIFALFEGVMALRMVKDHKEHGL